VRLTRGSSFSVSFGNIFAPVLLRQQKSVIAG
jgi:hypothetical protein